MASGTRRLRLLAVTLCLLAATACEQLAQQASPSARTSAPDQYADWPEECRPAVAAFMDMGFAIKGRIDAGGGTQEYFSSVPPDFAETNWQEIGAIAEQTAVSVTNRTYGTDLQTMAEVTDYAKTLPPSQDRGATLLFFPAFHRNLQTEGFSQLEADSILWRAVSGMSAVTCGGKSRF